MTPTTLRDVKARGVRLRVAEAGSGSTVLLLHGLFLDHTTWHPVAEALSASFRVVAPDFPGFGSSEKPSPDRFAYDIDAFTGVVADLYAGLDLGRAAVVGHDLGGAVAVTLAARHPELVSRLVLVDVLSYPAPLDILRRLALVPVLGGFVVKQAWGRALFRSFFLRQLVSDPASVAAEKIDAYYAAFNTPEARGSALATLRRTTDTRAVVAHTSGITVPTLVAWGRRDRLLPAAHGQRLARRIRGAGFELFDSGHLPHEERPTEFARTLLGFLRDQR